MIDGCYKSLAIFGGIPSFPESLHVGRPNLGKRSDIMGLIGDALDRRWLSNDGPLLREFESKLAAFLDVPYCACVSNGTLALAIAARASGFKTEAIVPAFTFVATPHALKWQGIEPVFCDVERETHQIDVADAERHITNSTSGLVGVHTWGRPCDVDGLLALGNRYNLPIIFDAAPAFGCSYKGVKIGGFGQAETFSFHATKVLNAVEGGAIVTNDESIYSKSKLMRSFGFAEEDKVSALGINAKMSEISAAMGIASLDSYSEFRIANKRNYTTYKKLMSPLAGVKVLEYPASEESNYHNIVIEIDEEVCGVTRDELLAILRAENILARRYFYPGCHKMEPYVSGSRVANSSFPNTDYISSRVLSLPTGTSIGEAEILLVCQIIETVVSNGESIRSRLLQ